jgi:hypothetical protein
VDDSRVMIVLPTLGKRLAHLETALLSCDELAKKISVTICVVVPEAAVEARKIAAKYGATLVEDPGTGMSDAVNAATAKRTTEEFYIWLGDDDCLISEGTLLLIQALDSKPDAVVAYGKCQYINDGGEVIATNSAGKWAQFFLSWGPNLIPHPGTLIRMDALEKIGGFNSSLLYALDLDVFLRLKKMGSFVSVQAVVSQFRWHEESLTVEDRGASSREAMQVKAFHLTAWLRFLAPLWQWPVAWASWLAAERITVLSKKRTQRGVR